MRSRWTIVLCFLVGAALPCIGQDETADMGSAGGEPSSMEASAPESPPPPPESSQDLATEPPDQPMFVPPEEATDVPSHDTLGRGEAASSRVPGDTELESSTDAARAADEPTPAAGPSPRVKPDRLAETLERIEAQAASPSPLPSSPQGADRLEDTLLREARLGAASASTALAEAELQLQTLRTEALALSRLVQTYPESVIRGERTVAQAMEEIARLASEQERYDALYRSLLAQRADARARAEEYQRLFERAQKGLGGRLSDPAVRTALAKVRERAELAARLADVLGRSVSLAAANAEAASQAIASIQRVVATAGERALRYRSAHRAYHRPSDQAVEDLRQIPLAAFGRPQSGSYVLPYWFIYTVCLVGLAALLDWILSLGAAAHARRRGIARGTTRDLLVLLGRRVVVWWVLSTTCGAIGLQPVTVRFYSLAAALWLGVLTLYNLFHRFPIPEGCVDRDLRLWTRKWVLGLAAVTAFLLPFVRVLRLVEYPDPIATAQVEAALGTALAVMVALWLGRPGALVALGQWSNAYWQRVAANEVHVRLSIIGLSVVTLGAHWLGWMNLARYVATGLSLTTMVLLGAVIVDDWLRSRFGLIQTDAQRARGSLLSTLSVALWVAAACTVAWSWGLRPHHVDRALAWLSSPVLSVQGVRVSVFSLARGIVVATVVILFGRVVRGWIERLSFGGRITQGSRFAAATLTYYVLVGGGILGGVLAAGLGLSVLTVFASVAGVAIGFGSQDIARNFISGLIILLDRSVNVGDFVTIGGVEGTVTEINIRCTTLRTPDNRRVVVPNSTLVGQQMIGANQLDRRVRVALDVQVAPDADPDEVAEVLEVAARSHPDVLSEPAPEVWMSKLAAASLSFQLQIWTDRVEARQEVTNQVLTTIWRELKSRGIGLV